MSNKETSIGVKLVADLRNYQTNMSKAQSQTKTFSKNVKAGMGDVSSSITAIIRGDITQLPTFFRSATTAAGGFSKGLKGVKVTLISTGIGALLVGIGLAIGAITQYFKGTEEGQIVFKRVMNNIKAYTEPVLQMFGKFGKAIMLLFKGEFKQAWETAKEAVSGVGEQIDINKSKVGELNALEEAYIKNKRKYLLENKKLEAEIAEARRLANDEENYTAQQRKKYIDEAIAKQRQLAANKQTLADQELKIEEIKASFGDNDIDTNDKLNELKSQQFDIMREQEMAIKRMGEDQQRITREIGNEVIKRQQALEAAKKLQEEVNSQVDADTDFKTDDTPEIDTPSIIGPLGAMQQHLSKLQELQNQALSPEKWQEYQRQIEATQNRMNEFTGNMQTTMSMTDQIGIMSQSFGMLGNAIGGAGGSFLQMAGTVLGMVPQLIMQITALTAAKGSEAIASGVAASQQVPFPLNIIALGATVASIIAALATKPPALASGGIAYGDTLARVGEYSGARANPEVIAPLDKLKSLLPSDGSGGDIHFEVKNEISGEKIVTMIRRVQRTENMRT